MIRGLLNVIPWFLLWVICVVIIVMFFMGADERRR